MKLTNLDCMKMFNGLNAIKQPSFAEIKDFEHREEYIFHVKFISTVALNKRALEGVVESLKEAEKFSEEFEQYLKDREEILLKYCKKDEEGNPIESIQIINGQQQRAYNVPGISDRKTPVAKELDALEKKNKEIIDARKNQDKQFQQTLKEDSTFEPKKVPFSMIPRGLSEKAMDVVIFMMEEEEKKNKK